MGNGYSSEEDEGNDEIQVQDPTEDVEVATHIKLRSTASGLAALHSPKMMGNRKEVLTFPLGT